MSQPDIEGAPESTLDDMFERRTTEQVVADIVSAEPAKHGVTLAERLKRAKDAATFDSTDEDDAKIRAAGGDPDELLPGNRPRYTVDEEGNVKDHQTGEVHMGGNKADVATGETAARHAYEQAYEQASFIEKVFIKSEDEFIARAVNEKKDFDIRAADAAATQEVEDDATALADTFARQATCVHYFGSNDPQPHDRCVGCAISFEEWANS